jgi:hypothetical protein
MSQLNYRVRSLKSQAALEQPLMASDRYDAAGKLESLMQSLQGGFDKAILEVAQDSDAAQGTFTLSGSGSSAVSVEGDILVGGTDYEIANLSASEIAVNLADAINGSASGNVQLVDAEAAGAVVTVTARSGGIIGNKLAIAASGAASVSGATLAGGTSGELKVFKFNLTL